MPGTNNGIILLNGGKVSSTGTGTLTLSGTGGNGHDQNSGIIDGVNSEVSSAGGAVSPVGHGRQRFG